MKAYDDQAADAYARVVTHYSMAAHVEDARERLIALNRPVPDPPRKNSPTVRQKSRAVPGSPLRIAPCCW